MNFINERNFNVLKWIGLLLIVSNASRTVKYSPYGPIMGCVGCTMLAAIYITNLWLYIRYTNKAVRRRATVIYLGVLSLLWSVMAVGILVGIITD